KIHYGLDPMGNRILEEVRDPANPNQPAQTRSRRYDNFSRLVQDISAQNHITAYTYYDQGNLKTIDGPLAGTDDTTTYNYDALNRLVQVINPSGGGQVNYGYNALDQLASVKDPRGLTTSYTRDGLDNLKQVISPDTGTTNNDPYDDAGNLKQSTDAK